MTDRPLGGLAPDRFLADHWQREPCLIRAAMPGFEAPLDGDDLAGLACEPLAEARIVSGTLEDHDWQVHHGPFRQTRFAALGDADWTLLVQDVEKHYPPLAELMAAFDFLPAWRMDDLMVSFAAPGGSVGPHVDQYDVFLLQAQGRRRWQIAMDPDPIMLRNCPLDVLAHFEPQREWVLDAGDMLYLPPGVAHHGVALDPCLTYSIGFRAPSAADLHLALGEHLSGRDDSGGRYADPHLAPPRRAGEIDAAALQRFRELALALPEDESAWSEFIGAFMSRYRLAHEPAAPEKAVRAEALSRHLARGGALMRNPWTRMNWVEHGAGARLFAAGQAHDCPLELAPRLCTPGPVNFEEPPGQAATALLLRLVNDGHLVLVDAIS